KNFPLSRSRFTRHSASVSADLLAPLLRSPRLIEEADALNRILAEEHQRRLKFHEEITDEAKWEFINGHVIMHSPAQNRHNRVVFRLANLLGNWVNLRQLGQVTVEKTLCQFPRNDYEPDLVFFSQPKAKLIRADTLLHPVPDFIVEVLSPATAANDRGVKFEDYAAHGVGEYWIVDPARETLEQFLLKEGAYPKTVKRLKTGSVTSAVIAGLEIPVRALFDDPANLAALRRMLGA
ncbi:MAG: Uma2 family endonuclease, partial [Verrucomicrobiae bacterium]|nr:Uma2 family endonuclease [Verrucomicrobiae bacterium]